MRVCLHTPPSRCAVSENFIANPSAKRGIATGQWLRAPASSDVASIAVPSASCPAKEPHSFLLFGARANGRAMSGESEERAALA